MTTTFIACKDDVTQEKTPEQEHTHTYESGWTSDDVYHWHKASCEHAEEISGKAEHIYAENSKCSVCGKDKIVTTHVSSETAWQNAFNFEGLSKVDYHMWVEEDGEKYAGNHLIIDGEKMYLLYYILPEIYSEAYMESIESEYILARENPTDEYQSMANQEEFVEFFNGIKEELLEYLEVVKTLKDKFNQATYSETNKNYKLTVDSTAFVITFENDKLSKVEYSFIEADETNFIEYNFSNIKIVFPQV